MRALLRILSGVMLSVSTAPLATAQSIPTLDQLYQAAKAEGQVVFGGAIKGGRVVADWPGLKPSQLYQDRDLAPTTDVRAILKGVLRDHLGVGEPTLTTKVFPDSIGVKPLDGLIA